MSAAREEVFSPDELRKRLYQTFKSRGVLDTLKTQLRNQMIQELKRPLLSGAETVPGPVSSKADSLLVTASNTIVADYLQTSGYEYTLSVFYPESGLRKDKIFSTRDLLQLMKISHHSSLYRSLTSNDHKAGFLMSLLTHLTDHHGHKPCCDADTQTSTVGCYRESLVDKMKMIDQEYDSLHHREDKWGSYESKLTAYKRELEAQMRAEMNTKMQHFKDVELAKVKLEERARSNQECVSFRQDLEKTYEMKTNALINREKNAIDRLQKQQEIEENNVYMQRQMLLKEIEKVRNRENELKLRMGAFEKTCEIHEKKVKTMEDLLRRREGTVKCSEDTYEQKLQSELSRHQLELKEEFIKRTEKLTENENKNKVETVRIQKDSAALEAKREEHVKACSELRRLQVALESSQQQFSLLSQQKDLLRERVEAMSDYSGLKRETVELHGQLRLLKRQLEEAHAENGLLRADAVKPSPEQLVLQAEVQRLRSAQRLDQEEFDNQRQVLQAQLQSEVARCAQLKAQLVECEAKTQWLTNHAEEMKTQLHQTQQALENEVLRNPKPSLVDRSVLELTDNLVPPDIYVQRSLLRGRMGHDDIYKGGRALQAHATPWAPSTSPHSEETDLLAGAKARIRKLEREAESLEEAYRNYQQRAVRSPICHMTGPRPHSPQPAHPLHCSDSPRRKPIAQRARAQSPQKPKVCGRPLSPKQQEQYTTRHTRTPSPEPCHTQSDSLAPQPRSTSLPETQPQGSGLRSFTDPLANLPGGPQAALSSPSGLLFPTQRSPSKQKLPPELTEEVTSWADLSPEGVVRPAASSADFSPDLSPPQSPQLKSTARDRVSPPRAQQVVSSSESSPQPEKINLEDLSESIAEPSNIPELLLDTAIPLSQEAPGRASVPLRQAPCDLPDTQILQQEKWAPLQSPPGESTRRDGEETEEVRWDRERKERQDRRRRELEEAKERELEELKRLERETEAEKSEGDEVGEKMDRIEEEGVGRVTSPAENPLEKYMKMILEARENQHTQSPVREEPEAISSEAKHLSGERDDSIAAYSHEAVDDDFW